MKETLTASYVIPLLLLLLHNFLLNVKGKQYEGGASALFAILPIFNMFAVFAIIFLLIKNSVAWLDYTEIQYRDLYDKQKVKHMITFLPLLSLLGLYFI